MRLSFLTVLSGALLTSIAFAADNRIDVSSIVSKADAKAILGTEVKDSRPRNVQGGDGYYSKCNYYSVTPGRTLLIRVYQAAPGYDAQKELETVTKDTPAVKTVSGLGDKALVTSGTASGLPSRVLMLYVMKANTLITIGLSGLDDESASEKARSIAEKILAQL